MKTYISVIIYIPKYFPSSDYKAEHMKFKSINFTLTPTYVI